MKNMSLGEYLAFAAAFGWSLVVIGIAYFADFWVNIFAADLRFLFSIPPVAILYITSGKSEKPHIIKALISLLVFMGTLPLIRHLTPGEVEVLRQEPKQVLMLIALVFVMQVAFLALSRQTKGQSFRRTQRKAQQ